MTIKAKKSSINLREKLAELLNFRQIRDRLDGLGLYLGKDRTGTSENLAVRGGANIDDLQLAEISAALGGTAVDVFVYDTRNDSDGGKWRERTQRTSWYNEELNTATRGSRREFPAVAVIVAEELNVTIYDGDDPDLPMWMVFMRLPLVAGNSNLLLAYNRQTTACEALNGQIFVSDTVDLGVIDFLKDKGFIYGSLGLYDSHCEIADRNELSKVNYKVIDTGLKIEEGSVNDVAVTVLPNAPIDSETGLPIPTIAVATDGGVSVIKDDGSVVDITCSQASFEYSYYVVFDQLNRLFFSFDGQGNSRRIWGLNNIPTGDLVVTTNINEKQNGDIFIADDNGYGTATKDMFLFNQPFSHVIGLTSDNSIGTIKGLFKAFINKQDSSKSLYNYITSKYNTGWMPGDIKLATLSDRTVETVGVDESDNLVNNGDFSDPFDEANDGWYDKPVSGVSTPWTISGGVASHAGDQSYLQQNNVFEIGKQYALTFTVTGITILPGSTGLTQSNVTFSNGTYTYVGTAIKTYLSFYSNTTTTIGNVSVTETGELITNGKFDNGTTGWTNNGMATFEVSSAQAYSGTNSLHVVADSNVDNVQQSFVVEAGKTYVFTAAVYQATTAPYRIRIGDVASGDPLWNSGDIGGTIAHHQGSWKVYNVQFTATSTESELIFAETTTANACDLYIDAVSVRLAEDDRSVNDNGLQVFGEITKSPVAPGADLVAYSGFSARNYLMQPYNSDLDFTDTMFAAIWLKDCIAGVDVFSRGTRYTDHSYGLYFDGGNDFRFYYSSDGETDQRIEIGDGQLDMSSGWHFACISIDAGAVSLYIDGVLRKTDTLDGNFYSQATDQRPLRIGPGSVSGQAWGTMELALFRISATAPTPEQIAKIYRDEKVLFQDGAQATLYGTSDAVTALAYDDKTELLHVGTSGGRSDFAGLRRINNTTTPVTTSISANNNLIAEQ